MLSRDVDSSRMNHKTSRGRYSQRASGGRSWRPKSWHVVRWRRFVSQITLLKFNERTYGAKIYNSEFSAAAVCSRCCYPHFHFQSLFFPFDLSNIYFINFHRIHQWATCWPVSVSQHPEVSPLTLLASFCFMVRRIPLRSVTCYDAFCLHFVSSCLCNPVFCPNLALFLLPLTVSVL
jgi:hypothetical protein